MIGRRSRANPARGDSAADAIAIRIIRFDDVHSVVAVSLLANGLVAFVLVLTGMLSQLELTRARGS